MRAPAALVIAISLSALRTGMAEPCAPRAELDGDRAAVEQVASELQRLGVVIAPGTATCPAVRAMVALDDRGRIEVAVRGASQRSEGRVMTDAPLAAAWIDSWARDDLEVATWSGAPGDASGELAAPTPGRDLEAPRELAPPEATPRKGVWSTGSLSAAYELAWTNDSTSWTGFGASGCVRVGWACVGARIHGAFQGRVTSNATAAARTDVAALATASVPIVAGQTIIAPELGVGVGRFSTRRLDGCMPNNVTPGSACVPGPGGMPPPYVGDGFDQATYAPRIALAVRLTIPLFPHVWLDGLASLSFAPLGHADPYGPTQAPQTPVPPALIALPGEPDRSFQLGIGVRVGAP